jgi:putative transposase
VNSSVRRGKCGLSQQHNWQHSIRDEIDFERQVNTLQFSPVKHGWVVQAVDWPYSSINPSLLAPRPAAHSLGLRGR